MSVYPKEMYQFDWMKEFGEPRTMTIQARYAHEDDIGFVTAHDPSDPEKRIYLLAEFGDGVINRLLARHSHTRMLVDEPTREGAGTWCAVPNGDDDAD